MAERRWHELHWLTWLLLFMVAATLASVQTIGFRRARRFDARFNGVPVYHRGWPLVYSEAFYFPKQFTASQDRFAPHWLPRLSIDLGSSLVGGACTAYAAERLIRSRWQFRLSTLFIVAMVVGAFFASLATLQAMLTPREEWGFVWHSAPHPWYCYPSENWLKVIVTDLVLMCTFYALICVSVRGAARFKRHFREAGARPPQGSAQRHGE